MTEMVEQNRRSWNAVVPAHTSHYAEQADFFRNGGSALFAEERTLLGDVAGKQVAHLMCNTGQQTLSLAQLGAHAVGVDISDAAITSARQLAHAAGVGATFECGDIYDWLDATTCSARRFDVVYCAYGVICWLPDLERWAKGVAAVLNSGGRVVLVEFHPLSNMLDHDWRLTKPYPAGGRPLQLDGVGDYVGASEGGLAPGNFVPGVQDFKNPEPCTLFQWGVGEVVTALAQAGLRLEALHEYPYTNGERPFARMQADAQRRMHPPAGIPAMPLMYGLACVNDQWPLTVKR